VNERRLFALSTKWILTLIEAALGHDEPLIVMRGTVKSVDRSVGLGGVWHLDDCEGCRSAEGSHLQSAYPISTVWAGLNERKRFWFNAFQGTILRWKELSDAASLSASSGATARRLSGASPTLPRRDESPGGLRPAVRRLVAQSEESDRLLHLARRPALRRGAPERRVDRQPLRPRSPDHPAVARRGRLGP
jgi:hypothetical protein